VNLSAIITSYETAAPSILQPNATELTNSSAPVPSQPPTSDSVTNSSSQAGDQSEPKFTSSGRTVYRPSRFENLVYPHAERRQQSVALEDPPDRTDKTMTAGSPKVDPRRRWSRAKLINELDRLQQQNALLNDKIRKLNRKNQSLQQEAFERGSKKEASVETDGVVERKLRKLFRDTEAWSEKWSTKDRLSDAMAKFKETTSRLSDEGFISQETSRNIGGLKQTDMRPKHLFSMLLNEMICMNTFKRPFGYFRHLGEYEQGDLAEDMEPCLDLIVTLAMIRNISAFGGGC
jgi:hypothetical protein